MLDIIKLLQNAKYTSIDFLQPLLFFDLQPLFYLYFP